MTDNSHSTGAGSAHSRRRFLKLAGAGTVVATTSLAGCSDDGGDGGDGGGGDGGDGGNGGDGGSTGGGDLEPLIVGDCEALTGPYSTGAQQKLAGTETAIEVLRNDPEFEREIQLVTGDTELDPSKAIELVNRFIEDDGMQAFIGCTSSSTGLAVNPLLEENGIYHGSGQGSDQFLGEECHFYHYPTYIHSSPSAEAIIPLVLEQDFGSRWYTITADYAFGQDQRDAIKRFANDRDELEFLGDDPTPFGHDDYGPQFARVRDADPDVLFMNHWANDTATCTKQAIAEGLHEEMELVVPAWVDFAATQLAEDSVQHVWGGVSWTNDVDNPATDTLIEASLEHNDSMPTESIQMNYKGMMMVGEAVKQSGSIDPDEFCQVLHDNNLADIADTISLHGRDDERYRNADHEAMKPYYLVQGKSPGEEREDQWDVFNLIDTVEPDEYVNDPRAECDLAMPS